jgi:nicotinamide-nucleotide amidase
VEKDRHVIIAMPGPPGEMQQMWSSVVAPRIQREFCDAVIFSSTMKTFSLSEAKLGEITKSFLLARNPTVGIYAKPDGIHLRIAAKADSLEEAKRLVKSTADEIRPLVGDYIWGTDSDTLETIIADLFTRKKLSLSTMETDTGGILSNIITNVPGSRQFFKCGIVINRSDLGEEYGVSGSVISQYGPLSLEAVREMATSVRRKYDTSVGVGLAGVVENDDPSHKLGTILIGIDDGKQNYTFQRVYPGTRLQIKQRAAIAALFELRKIML